MIGSGCAKPVTASKRPARGAVGVREQRGGDLLDVGGAGPRWREG